MPQLSQHRIKAKALKSGQKEDQFGFNFTITRSSSLINFFEGKWKKLWEIFKAIAIEIRPQESKGQLAHLKGFQDLFLGI